MFGQTWSTEGCHVLFQKGYSLTSVDDAKLPQDIQVLDLVADSYSMIVQLVPAIAARAQAGEEYAFDGRLFSMLFCVWWTSHNKLQKNTSAIDEKMRWLRVGCKKHVSS